MGAGWGGVVGTRWGGEGAASKAACGCWQGRPDGETVYVPVAGSAPGRGVRLPVSAPACPWAAGAVDSRTGRLRVHPLTRPAWPDLFMMTVMVMNITRPKNRNNASGRALM